MEYFSLLYRLKGEDRYLIWISNETESVVVDADGLIPTFKDPQLLSRYADLNHYRLRSEEPTLHDLDWVGTWITSVGLPVNCEEALAAWNLFSDVAHSIGDRGIAFEHLDSLSAAIYQKLFWGNNLPSVTPEGSHYVPEWSSDEIGSLAMVLTSGLSMFVSSTRSWLQES